jgi:HK97 family phage prohead protease
VERLSDERRLIEAMQRLSRDMQRETLIMRRDRLARETEQLRRSHRFERMSIRIEQFETKFSSSAPAGTFSGYGAVFNEPHPTSARSLSADYVDTIAPGAFKRTLAEHKARGSLPAMVWQHDLDIPIGVWTSMLEDRTGLFIEGRLSLGTPESTHAFDLMSMAAEAGLSGLGLSIGFCVAEAEIDRQQMTRNITDVDLFEVSPVVVPAIAGARVTQVRGS